MYMLSSTYKHTTNHDLIPISYSLIYNLLKPITENITFFCCKLQTVASITSETGSCSQIQAAIIQKWKHEKKVSCQRITPSLKMNFV